MAHDATGPLYVTLTDFHSKSRTAAPRIWRTGLGLAEAWPELPGAVSVLLWGSVWGVRSGSVSLWTDESAMRNFVRTPAHVETMRAFRDRGSIFTQSWEVAGFSGDDIWEAARRRLR
jgi:heme-degrading monooxygenase HmoA